ncbi:HD domain-containing protein [Conexibacter sp. DBS9H8]|uniref:HD domain-containing protein n=1 Tax=Conexibacter sp. DBS9H8 TaxID=2937801 RepID=UPI00200F09F1|nr:hypothetical protein [Conexibacter sp. DBS9H8]
MFETLAACASMAGLPYDGEPVDQLEHALQCATLALTMTGPGDAHSLGAADPEFVIACLLHDIARAPAVAGMATDAPGEHHGAAAARWLTPRYGARVAWLAAEHVPAKRYLVTTDPTYRDCLSPVSARTLAAQGGAMSPAEIAAFRAHPDHRLAVALRRYDDQAKVPGARVSGLDRYRPLLASVAAGGISRTRR